MEFLSSVLNGLSVAFLAKVLFSMMIIQAILAASVAILNVVAPKTETKADDKALSVIQKIIAPFSALLELVRGNVAKRK